MELELEFLFYLNSLLTYTTNHLAELRAGPCAFVFHCPQKAYFGGEHPMGDLLFVGSEYTVSSQIQFLVRS